ncbi:hypothetical protein B0I29_11783 [Actinoplanes lutulentus]|uniref:Uncharacterized protein n=2 Tax=Actinoplanes lutulentus TaxID=1287878 RepID=A0A327Z334_9ACTN|nr:hypothetical protein B0I29_11783 [Actinoplanes lutulentus]
MTTVLAAAGFMGGCGFPLPDAESGQAEDSSFDYPLEGRPERIAIDQNDYEAKHVGHTADGGQFFLTTPSDFGGRGFVALYLFDSDGRFVEAKIDLFAEELYQRRLKELDGVTFDRIVVEPFEVERFNQTFGLITDEPEAGDEIWWVTAEPGDYMAFSPPWDLGEYDT